MSERVLLDGFHAVKHALRFGATVSGLVTTDRAAVLAMAAELAPDLRDRLAADLAVATEVPGRGDVAGWADRPPAPDLTAATAPVVLLDNPRNLGNVGAVVRVAAGFSAGAVVTLGTLDPWHPTVLRGAAGLHFAVPVARLPAIPVTTGPLVAFDAGGTDLADLVIPDDAVLAFGSERHGLSAGVRARADLVAGIPIRPLVSSYNLATSVAIALYHWSSRR